MQFFKQLPHDSLLFWCSGISRTAFSIQPSFVTNPDRVAVMWVAVSTDLLDRSSKLNGSIPAHHIVITDAFPAPLLVPQINVRSTAPLPRTDSRAMTNNKCDNSHFCDFCYFCETKLPHARRCSESCQNSRKEIDQSLNTEFKDFLLLHNFQFSTVNFLSNERHHARMFG